MERVESSPVKTDGSPRTDNQSSRTSTPQSKSTSGDIVFEGQWEEDDLVALSGGTGESFHKIHTTRGDDQNKTSSKKILSVDLSKLDISENLLSDSEVDGIMTPEELMTPDDMDSSVGSPQHFSGVDLEWDNDTPVLQPTDEIAIPESVHGSNWRSVVIGEKNYKLDLAAITPYRQVLAHGGYYGEGLNAIVVFSACFLPDSEETDYRYIMDNLFLYVVSTLELLVAEDYMIIVFNGGCRRRNFPALNWLKKCYQMIHRRLRKNLKQLIVVHPSWYIRLLIGFFRPFISSKFSRKLKLATDLHELADLVPLDGVTVPDAVQIFDMKLLAANKSPKRAQTINAVVQDSSKDKKDDAQG